MQTGENWHGMKLAAYCGGGAYGDVYLAQELSGRTVALKIVSKQRLGEHWRRELKGVVNYCRITETAPELLQVFHVEEDESYFFYTMEAADPVTPGADAAAYHPDTLHARLRHGALQGPELRAAIAGIFAGICAIHRAGFAHRDVKPDNILFVKGRPKLGDIGLTTSLSATGTLIAGTLEFLPPEIRSGENAAAPDRRSRQRSDLYAFGKVIYCAATGQEPQAWPAVPDRLPLTPELKCFLHLAFQLCDRDPLRRLHSVESVARELARIERVLTTGENFREKLAYYLHSCGCAILLTGLLTGRRLWRFRYGLLLLFVIAAGACGGLWHLWNVRYAAAAKNGNPAPAGETPQPPSVPLPVPTEAPANDGGLSQIRKTRKDILKEMFRAYRNPTLGVQMTIPAQWEVLSNATLKKIIAETRLKPPSDPMVRLGIKSFQSVAQNNGEMLILNYTPEWNDNISIQELRLNADGLAELAGLPEDQMRVLLRSQIQKVFGVKAEIYAVSRMQLAGVPCGFIDYSVMPQENRTQTFLFFRPDRVTIITFEAQLNTFDLLHQEFEQVLKTLQFF